MKRTTLIFNTDRGHSISVKVPSYLNPKEFWVEGEVIYHEDMVDENGHFMAVTSRPALRWVRDFSTYTVEK